MTSTTKGNTRAIVNRAPPSGEPASWTIAFRPDLDGGGIGQLMRRDDGPHRPRIRGDEERRAHALDERDHRDQPERIRAQRDDDHEDAHGDDAHGVRADHQPLAVPAVRDDARGQGEERVRDRSREKDEAGLGRRAREREHEQRIGDRRQPRTDVRQQLPGLEQHEVAVTAQGNRVHGTTLPGVRGVP